MKEGKGRRRSKQDEEERSDSRKEDKNKGER